MKEETKAKFKAFWGRISYAIVPFIVFVAVLGLTYFGNQLVYRLQGATGGTNWPQIPLDSQIPYVPWFIYFYFLTFPLGAFTFFYVAYASKKAFWRIFYTLIISFLISGVIYLCWQTRFTKPDILPNTFTDKIVIWTWGSTYPINCFPSQHSFMAFAMIIGVLTAGKDMKWWYKAGTVFVCLMIVLATFFVKQHFFLDWVGSLAIMLLAYGAVLLVQYIIKKVRQRKTQTKAQTKMHTAQNEKKLQNVQKKKEIQETQEKHENEQIIEEL